MTELLCHTSHRGDVSKGSYNTMPCSGLQITIHHITGSRVTEFRGRTAQGHRRGDAKTQSVRLACELSRARRRCWTSSRRGRSNCGSPALPRTRSPRAQVQGAGTWTPSQNIWAKNLTSTLSNFMTGGNSVNSQASASSLAK